MRLRGTELAVSLLVVCSSAADVWAQDVRLVQQNGTKFVESTETVRQPVVDTTVERQEQTVYREEYITQMRETQQTYFAPVTEYRWEPRVHGRLNPFRPNTVAYHLVPHTRWEPRTHTIRTPVTTRQLRPQTRVVEVPRRRIGFVEQQRTTRTALAPGSGPAGNATAGSAVSGNGGNAASGAGSGIAARHHALPSAAPQTAAVVAGNSAAGGGSQVSVPHTASRAGVIGGVHQLDGDHPRFGTSTQRY